MEPEMKNGGGPTDSGEGPTEDPGIELLLWQYVERINAGETIQASEVYAAHPEDARDILEQLEAFQSIHREIHPEQNLGTLGDYTLRRQIGRGGMGVVYEAWENSMDRRVALKVLPPGVAADERALHRFVREAKTAGQLNHPNIVSVYGMGLKEQTPYYAMEFVEGETLAQVLKRVSGAPPEAETPFGKKDDVRYFANLAEVFSDTADGLQHAHSKGIVHRDLKPSNLILDREGRLRILDFGLAHLEGQESLTASGDLLGTVLYMSPEQARRKNIAVDHRTDIYSLGVTLYEVLAGRPPFQGKDHEDTLSQIIERDPVEPRKWSPRIPRELETIVLKCLRKDPADRYGTAEALGQDLRRFVRGDPVEARPESRWGKLSRRLHRNRIALLAAGVLALLLGALGWQAWERYLAEREAREAARLLHDATVRDAAIELSSGQLTILGQDTYELVSFFYIFRGEKCRKGPAGVQDTLSALDRAAEVVGERPDAPYYLARLYRLAGDEEAAGREAARALERERDFVPAEVLAREIALDRGSLPDEEIEGILARFAVADGWQVPWLQAYKHTRSRSWPEAADSYGRLLKFRDPEPYVGFTVEALMGRGIAHLHRGDFLGAVSDFAGARGIWPRLPEAGFALGVAWHRAGHADQAEKIFLELHTGSPEETQGGIAAWICLFYANAGDSAKEKQWLQRIDGWARDFFKCADLYGQCRYEECIKEIRKILDERPGASAPLCLLGWAKCQLQWGQRGPRWDAERQEILELALKARDLYPNDRHARILLAMALQLNGRPEEALKTIDGAIRHRIRLGENEYTDLVVQGLILRLQGKLKKAEEAIFAALEDFPGNGALRYELARTYELMGRDEEAQQEYRALTAGGGGSANAYSQLAAVLNRLGRPEEAAEAAREALRRLPKNPSASEQLARALWKLGRSEEALEAVEAGIREIPDRDHLHFVKGRILEDLGRLEEAAKAFAQELGLRLEDAESHEALGRLLKARPDLASSQEIQAVGEAIEQRRSAGSCEALLLESLALIRGEEARRDAGGPLPAPGK